MIMSFSERSKLLEISNSSDKATDYLRYNFIHTFTTDRSIRIIGVQFTKSVCFIRVVANALLRYMDF